MQAKRILETCLYVDDLDSAEEFYRQVLGLELYSRSVGRHVFFRCGEQFFLLFNAMETRKGDKAPAHGAIGEGHVGFWMEPDDSVAWREHLERNGVTIEHEVKSPNGLFAIYFRDPSGNGVELVTREWWD